MKIVLIPGMDGTGKLFEPLIRELKEYDCQIISLPSTENQDYEILVGYVKNQLPVEDCILVAESFSGPIGAYLAEEEQVKGVVFVATFLTPPRKFLLAMSQILPIKFLNKLPGSGLVLQSMMFGHMASKQLLDQFKNIINDMDAYVLKSRLRTLRSLTFNGLKTKTPALFVLPNDDRLVSKGKHEEFSMYFSNLKIIELNGPHFILQTNPVDGARVIIDFVISCQ